MSTKTLPVLQIAPRPTDERCPDFDEDCLEIEPDLWFHCWNNTWGDFDTTRPGYCPMIHEIPTEARGED